MLLARDTRSGPAHPALQRKQKALNDMANNEDWLDGKHSRKSRVWTYNLIQ